MRVRLPVDAFRVVGRSPTDLLEKQLTRIRDPRQFAARKAAQAARQGNRDILWIRSSLRR